MLVGKWLVHVSPNPSYVGSSSSRPPLHLTTRPLAPNVPWGTGTFSRGLGETLLTA